MNKRWHKRLPSSAWGIRVCARVLIGALVLWAGVSAFAATPTATRPLRTTPLDHLDRIVPRDTHMLVTTGAIESFLRQLDGSPPDWATIYGGGHGDQDFDDRLFALNRQRDAARIGTGAIEQRVAFLWHGALTDYDLRAAGFRVGVGPQVTETAWGSVRFKPEGLPGHLMAVPNPQIRKTLRRRFEQGERTEISVVIIGRLVPEESIIYDFSHEQEGRGMVMPVVEVERVEFVYSP